MTIAGVYLTSEGIVIGADSTSSHPCEGGMHYFDFNQKVFEIGEGSTFALTTWGLGGLGEVSYRTLIARLNDEVTANPVNSISELMTKWLGIFSTEYSNFALVQYVQHLATLTPYDPQAATPAAGSRTDVQEAQFADLSHSLGVGFCIAGYVESDRKPQYAHVFFEPTMNGLPQVTIVNAVNSQNWWGVPNVINRLIFGADDNLINALVNSGKWAGSTQDLIDILQGQRFIHGALPIRDAIDYVHSCISSTIKAMKFSSFSQVCGGPIEVAVITTDRKFRWVRHKSWDAAILDGGL